MPRMQMYENRSQKCSTEEIPFGLSVNFAGFFFDSLVLYKYVWHISSDFWLSSL